jgi:proteasome accessory factor B
MHRIHQLLQNEEYPNCTKLAKEFEVAKRTMKRDIEFMKDRMNLPIGFNVQRNGYFYREKVDRFPELPMSEAEVSGHVSGTPRQGAPRPRPSHRRVLRRMNPQTVQARSVDFS